MSNPNSDPSKGNFFNFLQDSNEKTNKKNNDQTGNNQNNNNQTNIFFNNNSNNPNTSNNANSVNPLAFLAPSGSLFSGPSTSFLNTNNNTKTESKNNNNNSSNQPTFGLFSSSTNFNNFNSNNNAGSLFSNIPSKNDQKNQSNNSSLFTLAPKKDKQTAQNNRKPPQQPTSLFSTQDLFQKKGSLFGTGQTTPSGDSKPQNNVPSIFSAGGGGFFTQQKEQPNKNPQKLSAISEQSHLSPMDTQKKSASPMMSVEASKDKSEVKSSFNNENNNKTSLLFGNINNNQKKDEGVLESGVFENKNELEKEQTQKQEKKGFQVPVFNDRKKQSNSNKLKQTNSVQQNSILSSGLFEGNKKQNLFQAKVMLGVGFDKKDKTSNPIIIEKKNQFQQEEVEVSNKIELKKVPQNEPEKPQKSFFINQKLINDNRSSVQNQYSSRIQNQYMKMSVQGDTQRFQSRINNNKSTNQKQTLTRDKNSISDLRLQDQQNQISIQQFLKISLLKYTEDAWTQISKRKLKPIILFILHLFNLSNSFKNQGLINIHQGSQNMKNYQLSKISKINQVLNNILKFYIKCFSISQSQETVKLFGKIFKYVIERQQLEKQFQTQGNNDQLNQNFMKQNIYIAQGYRSGQKKIINQDSRFIISLGYQYAICIQSLRKTALTILETFPKINFRPIKVTLKQKPQQISIFQNNLRFLCLKQSFDQTISNELAIYNKNLKEISAQTLQMCIKVLLYVGKKLGDNYAKITKDTCLDIIQFLNEIKGVQIIKSILKIFLIGVKIDTQGQKERYLSKNNSKSNSLWDDFQIQQKIFQSSSLQLLPLRFVIIKKMKKDDSQDFLPQAKDLFTFIQGSQWCNWVQYYIKGPNRYLQTSQKQFLVDVIKSFDQSSSIKIFDRKKQIFNFIMELKKQDQLIKFFDVLQGIAWSQQAIRKIEQLFFKNQEQIKYYFQISIKQILNSEQKQEQKQINKTKMKYLLKVVQVYPQKIYHYQNLLLNPLSDGINVLNLSCYRFCHFLIDMVRFYSSSNQSQMLAKVFNSITALFRYKDTKEYMILAMNIDRPQFTFYSQLSSLSKNLIQALNSQIILLLEAQQFYNCFNMIGDNLIYNIMTQMLKYRYTDKYSDLLQQNQSLNKLFPSFWIAQLMKVVSKQKYNPQLINSLAQKLLILPYRQVKQENQVQMPFLIECIIRALNSTKFEEHVLYYLEVGGPFQNASLNVNLYNKKLDHDYSNNYKDVLYTFKLVNTLLKLRKIIKTYGPNYYKHFIIKALSNLDCLETVYKSLTYSSHLYDDQHAKINPVTAIATHLYYSQDLKNLSNIQLTQWNTVSLSQKQAQQYLQQYQSQLRVIDHSLIRNFLANSQNIYMQSSQNLQTLTLQILQQLVNSQTDLASQNPISKTNQFSQSTHDIVCLQKLLYIVPATNKVLQKRSLQRNLLIKNKFKTQIISIINPQNVSNKSSQVIILKQKALNLIYSMLKSKPNRDFGFQIMKQYWNQKPKIDGQIRNNKLLTAIFIQQIQYANQNTIQSIQILQKMIYQVLSNQDKSKRLLSQICQEYTQKSFSLTTFHQFQKIIYQRQIIKGAQFYQWLQNVFQIVLQKIYNKSYQIDKIVSILIGFLVQHRMIGIKGQKFDQLNFFDFYRRKYPRKYNRDPLQYHISKQLTCQQLNFAQQIQKNNIVNWSSNISYKFNLSLNKFLAMLLSIDETFYANLPLNFSKSQANHSIFCHMHMGTLPYSAENLFGRNQYQAIQNVKNIGQLIIQSLKQTHNLRYSIQIEKKQQSQKINYNNQSNINSIHILGACVDWLSSKKKNIAQKAALALANQILTYKHLWLKPIIDSNVVARLLMSVILVKKSIPQENESNRYINQAIYDSIFQKNVQNSYLNQQILSILNLLPPKFEQQFRIQMIVNLWSRQTSNQFFYNESRVMVQLAKKYPILLAKLRPFDNCQKLKQIASYNTSIRYTNNQRAPQQIIWLWTLIIITTLCNSCQTSSTVLIQLLNDFMKKYKGRILRVLSQKSTFASINQYSLRTIQFAYLEQLDQTLQFLATVFNQQLWINMNRQYFEEIMYILTHKTICFFTLQDSNQRQYVPSSQNQIKLSEIKYIDQQKLSASLGLSIVNSLSYDKKDGIPTICNKSLIESKSNVFKIAMQIKYFSVLKSWIAATQYGISESWYVQKYFQYSIEKTSRQFVQGIDRNNENYRYSITYWDRMNKSLMDIARSIVISVHKLLNIDNLDKFLFLINNCLKAPQTFIDNGYLNTLFILPSSKTELLQQFRAHSFLVCELSLTHLMHQIAYKDKYGTLIRNHLQGFQKRIILVSKQFEEKFIQLQDDDPIIDSNYFKNFRNNIENIQIR